MYSLLNAEMIRIHQVVRRALGLCRWDADDDYRTDQTLLLRP